MPRHSGHRIRTFYRVLADAWGPQNWWPAGTRFEVIVGAYLTQNTAWTNVTRALNNLRAAGCLTLEGVRDVPIIALEQLIRPAGYFHQKALRLKTFVRFVDVTYDGDLERMFAQKIDILRQQLLALNGVGPETADSILLYAGNHPIFVVDAYTRRIFERHGITDRSATYEDIRRLVENALVASPSESSVKRVRPGDHTGAATHPPSPVSTMRRDGVTQVFNEMHAMIVGVGKSYCFKSVPKCQNCPLRVFLPPLPRAQ